MAESQIVDVIRMWAAVAWVDGTLAPAEAEGLTRLIREVELTAAERETAMRFLDGPVEIPDMYVEHLTPVVRRGIYRAACRMAVTDHVFAASERWMLDRLRDMLELGEEDAKELEAEVPGIV